MLNLCPSRCLAALGLVLLASLAKAESFTFTSSDPGYTGSMLSFSIAESASQLAYFGDLHQYQTHSSTAVQIGIMQELSWINFYAAGNGIWLNSGDDVLQLSGGSFFTGAAQDLDFVAGSYAATLFNFEPYAGIPSHTTTGTLTIAATPEPSSFLLLATGLLGVGGTFQRRQGGTARQS